MSQSPPLVTLDPGQVTQPSGVSALDPIPPRLTVAFKSVFGLGSMAEAIVYSTTATFALLFYNQVLGLNAAAVGAVMAGGVIINSACEPLIGSWSDRTRSRIGRRHPFMFVAILPVALSFYALFSPPAALGATGKLVWLAVANLMLSQAVTAFHTPHLAFGGELSSSYTERTRVMGYNTFFLWAGDFTCWWLAFGWFFAASAHYPNGALDPTRWPVFATTVSATVFVCLFVSSVFTLPRVRWIRQPARASTRASPVESMRDILRALKNRNFRMLLWGYVCLSMTSGVRAGLWIYTATYIWLLDNGQIVWLSIGSLIGYTSAAAVVAWLHARFGKRATGAVAVVIYSVCPAIPLALAAAGMIGPHTPYLIPLLLAFSPTQHLPFSVFTTTVYSTISDIADENELRFGIRQEGVLYSTSTLFVKVDQAIGAALAGGVLSWISFPLHAHPGAVDPSILRNLAITYVLVGIPGIVAAWFYGRISIDKASHAATQAALTRRAA